MFSLWYSLLLLLVYTGFLAKSSAELFVTNGSRLLQESNMVGEGGVVFANNFWDGIIPTECKPNPSIIRLNSQRKWVKAQEPLHADFDANKLCGVGPGMAFANTLRQKDSRNIGIIGLVPCAIGGTRISQWARGTQLYNMFITRSQKSLTEGGRIRPVLWYHGESDTVSRKDADSYGHNLKNFVLNFQARSSSSHAPFDSGITIQVALATAEEPYKAIVRKAQLEMDLPNVWTVDANGLPAGPDGIHLSTKAQVRVGQMLAEAYLTRTAHQNRPISNSASKRNL
ncbi:hypothetical protein MKX01_006101 [Papaver californicum]|nr:hypothetical protein MKX01_006101 [Papaver californicum]